MGRRTSSCPRTGTLGCPQCGEGTAETSWHCLAECAAYEVERQDLWADVPLAARRQHAVMTTDNFRIFSNTARAIGKNKDYVKEFSEY